MKPILALFAALVIAAAPALAVPVTVVIVGSDKKPLDTARLDVFDSVKEGEKFASREIAGTGGRFSFNWRGKFAASPDAATSPGNMILVRAHAPGLATKITFIKERATVIELGARRAWGGLVLDQQQRPIAGATVAREGIWVPAWKTQSQVVTDASGRWQMDDLPREGTLSIKVSEPNTIAANYSLNLANDEAPPLFLKPGATIRGQVVMPDGKPIENAPVVAGYKFANVARTDKEGRFVLSGIDAGEVALISRDVYGELRGQKSADVGYVIPNFGQVRAVAGETTDIGQWKAMEGVLVTLRALDATTGKPMRDTFFNISGSISTSVSADAQGQARARVVPESHYLGPYMGNVSAPGYITARIPKRSLKTASGEIDLGTVKLERGASVKGKILVQGETPQNNAGLPMLALKSRDDTSYIRFWSGTDTFQTDPLKPGNYKISVQDWRGHPDKNWQIIAPLNLAVPAPAVGAKNPAIEIVVKRLTMQAAPTMLRKVRGQILDENGQGVGGALVKMRLKAGDMVSETSAISGNDGKWSQNANFAATKVEVENIERPGYIRVGEARSAIKDGIALVSGLSMKRLGGVFAGRVVGANGKGAAGAWGAVAEIENYPLAQADANGQFELRDLPIDKFTLLAANANEFGRQSADSKTKKLEIKLQPNAESNREAVINDALKGDFEWWRIADYWDSLGSERMGELAKRGGENGDWSRTRYALELAEREPKKFGARADELTQGLDDEQKSEIEAAWNWARAASPDWIDKISLDNWVDAQKAVKRSIDAANVLQLLRVAAVAHRLHRDDADDLSDYAAAIAAQLKVDGSTAEKWGEPLAKSGWAAAQSFVEGLKPVPEFKLWWTAAGPIAEMGDIAGAQKALARMEALAQTPDWIALATRESWNNPTYQIEQVRAQIARALAKTDAPGAQKLAASIAEQSNRTETSLVIADRAIQAGKPEVAEAALRVAMQSTYGNPEPFALAASLAQEVSPELGAELWPDALRRTVPTEKRDASQGTFWPSVALWAFYHARLDAGQSRVTLEREWNWRLPAAVKAGADKAIDENDVASIDALVMAMSVVDPSRALEMRAEAARKVKSLAGKANVGLAAALLMSEAERVRFGVDSRLF